jgi:hypothetical protein
MNTESSLRDQVRVLNLVAGRDIGKIDKKEEPGSKKVNHAA